MTAADSGLLDVAQLRTAIRKIAALDYVACAKAYNASSYLCLMAAWVGLAYVHSVILCNAICAELGGGPPHSRARATKNTRPPPQPCGAAGVRTTRVRSRWKRLEAVVRDASASAFEHVVVEIVS